MDSLAESIGFLLDDLSVSGTSRFTADEIEGGKEGVSSEFLATCSRLLECLRFHNSSVTKCGSDVTFHGLYEIIKPLAPPFTVQQLDEHLGPYRILHFICIQLQAARMEASKAEGESRREVAGQRGKLVFQLDKICKDLRVTPEIENPNELDIITAVREKVAQVLENVPSEVISEPPKALPAILALSNTQKEILAKITKAYQDDFLLRRQMLMKRLDVTIQSFLWGEQAQGKEGEIVAAIQAQRKHLQEEPTAYTLSDAITAPVSLLHDHSKRVTDQSGKSLVKTVIIGSVPDRGGRANEIRPKASDLGFRRGGGGGGGGRGGGRGGGHGHAKRKGDGGGGRPGKGKKGKSDDN